MRVRTPRRDSGPPCQGEHLRSHAAAPTAAQTAAGSLTHHAHYMQPCTRGSNASELAARIAALA
eukprot:4772173-Prymnesium_polylepis.1